MSDQPDNTPQKNKNTEPEWTFSFETFGESIAQLMSQLGIGADADLQKVELQESIGHAERANIRLDLTVGRVIVTALPSDSPNLIEADVVSIGAVEMVTSTAGDTKSVRLRQKRNSGDDLLKPMKDAVDTVAHNPELEWVIRLSPNLPITLDIHAPLTLNQFDLQALNIPQLSMDSGAGKTDIILPTGVTKAKIDGGVGILDVTILDDSKTTLDLDIGAGATYLHIGYANLKAQIDGGVGNCEVNIPHDAAFRVRADSGLGNIVVPERAEPVKFESEFISESGLWESASYEFSAQKIDLRYEGGVGSLIVEETDEKAKNG